MKTMMALMAVMVMFLSPSLYAEGEIASLEVIGFDPEGFYFAFEQFGYREDSGFPYSEIHVVDIDENQFLFLPLVFDVQAEAEKAMENAEAAEAAGDDNAADIAFDSFDLIDLEIEDVRDRVRKMAVPLFRKYDLLNAEQPEPLFIDVASDGAFVGMENKEVDLELSDGMYSLKVSETDLPEMSNEDATVTPQLLKLELVHKESGVSVVLKNDESDLPEYRNSAHNYSIVLVARHNDSYVILLAYEMLDGDDGATKFMAVGFSL